jgi:hypothetical protein
MLQARKLSCSCQEATVTVPPGLAVLVVAALLGEQAPSSTTAVIMTPVDLKGRGLVAVVMTSFRISGSRRAPSGCSAAEGRQRSCRPVFYERPSAKVNESTPFPSFSNDGEAACATFPSRFFS